MAWLEVWKFASAQLCSEACGGAEEDGEGVEEQEGGALWSHALY